MSDNPKMTTLSDGTNTYDIYDDEALHKNQDGNLDLGGGEFLM